MKKKTVKVCVAMIMALFIVGCDAFKDQTYYEDSEFSRVHISELHKGYKIDGSGDYNNTKKGAYIYLYFCQNNRYKLIINIGKIYEGDFVIDTQRGTVTLIGDETDSKGNPMQGILSTNNGYIAQKKKLSVIGSNIDFEIYRVHQINSSDCNHTSR